VLRRAVPPQLEEAVHRALEKLPADRFSSAAEFGAALGEGKASGHTGRTVGRAPALAGRPQPVLRRLAVVGVAAALLGGFLGWRLGTRGAASAEPAGISRLAILAPVPGSIVSTGIARILDISPDGQVVVFSASGLASDYVALRRLDGSVPLAIPASDNVRNLHISPDGRYLYSPRGTSHMQRAPLTGGTWAAVPGIAATPFLSWTSDGTIWWSPDLGGGLHRVRAGSDKDETPFASGVNGKTTGFTMQQVLPGDRTALVVDNSTSNAGPTVVINLESGKVTTLLDFPVVEIRYGDGVLVYARPDNTLYGAAFDLAKGRVIGEPVQLADDVSLTGAGVAQFAVSANGTLVYLPTLGRELVQIERTGLTRPLVEAKLNYHSPRFSPDGRRIALDNIGPDGRDVWILDREQHQLIRATFDRDGHDPVWALDGKSIFYSSAKSGTFGIYRIRPGIGGGTGDSVIADNSLAYTGAPLADGKSLVTEAFDVSGKSITDVVLVHPGQAKPIEPLFATPFNEGWGVPSPDNKWVAFTSDQTGRLEVYVHPLGTEGTLTQISQDGGSEPMWSLDQRELFYRRPSGGTVEFMAAGVRLGREVEVIKRTVLFDASDYEPSQPHANYDVSPDGKSFVMIKRSPSSHIVIIQNLRALVRRSRSQPPR
jgi:serine/threonine-protein kinase